MCIARVGLEMHLEKTQRIDPRSTAFADGGALVGFPYRDFLKHGGQ